MKIVVLHGSPRKGGNSDTLVNYLLDGLTTSRPHEVSHFYLNEMQIRPCQGCESCFNVLPEFCAVRDDMQAIYRAFIDAAACGLCHADVLGLYDRPIKSGGGPHGSHRPPPLF